jgi:hypothetical protein
MGGVFGRLTARSSPAASARTNIVAKARPVKGVSPARARFNIAARPSLRISRFIGNIKDARQVLKQAHQIGRHVNQIRASLKGRSNTKHQWRDNVVASMAIAQMALASGSVPKGMNIQRQAADLSQSIRPVQQMLKVQTARNEQLPPQNRMTASVPRAPAMRL